MLRRPRIAIPLLLLAAFVVLTFVWTWQQDDPVVFLGDMHRTHHTVPLDEAESATVQIVAHHGEIVLHGGSGDLLAATFEHTYEGDRPQVTELAGGMFRIDQPEPRDLVLLGGYRLVEWDLRLGPVTWVVTLDAGDADVHVDLRGVTVSTLVITTDAGDVTLTLPEDSAAFVMAHSASGQTRADGLHAVTGGYVVQEGLALEDTIPVEVRSASGDITLRVAE